MRPLPPKKQPGCLIIGYPGRIKGVFGAKTAENSRKPVFGFRLSGGKGILQRSLSFDFRGGCHVGITVAAGPFAVIQVILGDG